MSAITTHVLDVSAGRPARDVAVTLERHEADNRWQEVGHGSTDADGRLRTLMAPGAPLIPGRYRLMFQTRAYFDRDGVRSFYPQITVDFEVGGGETHCHVPLLLSPFGYSTYRGS